MFRASKPRTDSSSSNAKTTSIGGAYGRYGERSPKSSELNVSASDAGGGGGLSDTDMTIQAMRLKELSQLVRAADYTIDSSAVAEAIIRRQAARRLLLGTVGAAAGDAGTLTSDARSRVDRARRSSH
jgi:hypothetical protein